MANNKQASNLFDDFKLKIAVVGVGGAGTNAINFMISESTKNNAKYDLNTDGSKMKNANQFDGVEFIACNTDMQALATSIAHKKIQMGPQLTLGLGAGADPSVGRKAAEESIDVIMDHLEGVHLLILTAGMGGGTGSEAVGVIAKHAKEKNILTIAIVTKPFEFEGQRRMRVAENGIKSLKEHVDTLLIINNENLFAISNIDTGFQQAFQMTDKVLFSAVNIFTRVIKGQGIVNLDFSDIRTSIKNMKGKAMIGEGSATGPDRAIEAAELAIKAPLLDEVELKNPKAILIYIIGGPDLKFWEINTAVNTIKSAILSPDHSSEANIIFGVTQDMENHDNMLQVCVIATGIEEQGIAAYNDIQNNEATCDEEQHIIPTTNHEDKQEITGSHHHHKYHDDLFFKKAIERDELHDSGKSKYESLWRFFMPSSNTSTTQKVDHSSDEQTIPSILLKNRDKDKNKNTPTNNNKNKK